MNTPTNAQLREMLQSAITSNLEEIGPDWMKANFLRCLRLETACLTLALGWDHVEPTEPNSAFVETALRNMWGDILSQSLVQANGVVATAAQDLGIALKFSRMEMMPLLGKQFCINGTELHDAIDVMGSFAGLGYSFPALHEYILEQLGYEWDDVLL